MCTLHSSDDAKTINSQRERRVPERQPLTSMCPEKIQYLNIQSSAKRMENKSAKGIVRLFGMKNECFKCSHAYAVLKKAPLQRLNVISRMLGLSAYRNICYGRFHRLVHREVIYRFGVTCEYRKRLEDRRLAEFKE